MGKDYFKKLPAPVSVLESLLSAIIEMFTFFFIHFHFYQIPQE